MFVFHLASFGLVTFFASTLYAASVALYTGTFDPPTQSEERIIRCALGDSDLSRECQQIGNEISRVLIFVNDRSGVDTLASTTERILMVKKALQEYRDRVEILASTPAQTAERFRTLLEDPSVDRVFHLVGPEALLNLDSVSAGYRNKIARPGFPLEHLASSRARLTHDQIAPGAQEVIAKLGLYQPLDEGLAQLERSLFEEGWKDFLDDLDAACSDIMNEKICNMLTSKWSSISIISRDEATQTDQSVSDHDLLIYKRSQSQARWAEKFAETATKFLEGTDRYKQFRAVADDLAVRTFRGHPYGKLPHLRRTFVQDKPPRHDSLKVNRTPVACSAHGGSYHMDMDRYSANRFPRALARFLHREFRHNSSAPVDLYVHNHSIEDAYDFHRRDQFTTFYFVQTRRGQFHRDIYLAVRSQPRAYRMVFTGVRGNDRRTNVLCQIHWTGLFTDYWFVQSEQTQPLFVLNAQGLSLRLNHDDLLLFGYKGNWSRALVASGWRRTPLVKEGLDIDVFTHPTNKRKLVIARNVYGDDTDLVLDTFYKKGIRRVIYLGNAGAVADYQVGDVVIPNEFVTAKSDSVPFPDNFAYEFEAELSRSLSVHGEKKHGWVPTLFHETKDLLLSWREKSIAAVDIEGFHLGRFARRHPDLKMGVFFIISDQTLGDSTINETNAHRGIIDASANKLISFLIGKFVHPVGLTFDIAGPTMIPWDRSKQELAREQ